MKRTSSMVYKQTPESYNLRASINGTPGTFEAMEDICKQLDKKRAKGIYNSNLAIDAFYNCVNQCMKKYQNYYKTSDTFSVQARFTEACDCVRAYEDDVRSGKRG